MKSAKVAAELPKPVFAELVFDAIETFTPLTEALSVAPGTGIDWVTPVRAAVTAGRFDPDQMVAALDTITDHYSVCMNNGPDLGLGPDQLGQLHDATLGLSNDLCQDIYQLDNAEHWAELVDTFIERIHQAGLGPAFLWQWVCGRQPVDDVELWVSLAPDWAGTIDELNDAVGKLVSSTA